MKKLLLIVLAIVVLLAGNEVYERGMKRLDEESKAHRLEMELNHFCPIDGFDVSYDSNNKTITVTHSVVTENGFCMDHTVNCENWPIEQIDEIYITVAKEETL